MKTVAIAIDEYKLETFENHLSERGYEYEVLDFIEGVLMLKVQCKNLEQLSVVIRRANQASQPS